MPSGIEAGIKMVQALKLIPAPVRIKTLLGIQDKFFKAIGYRNFKGIG